MKRETLTKLRTCRYAIDLPNPNNLDGECVNMGYFDSKKEALRWARKNIGTDAKGNFNVLTRLPRD